MTLAHLLDADVAAAIGMIPFEHLSAEELPALRMPFELPISDAVTRTEHVVEGQPALSVHVYRPKGHDDVELPCAYSMHGGGYVIGGAALDAPTFDRLCPALGLVGASVEYRLAPEAPFPAAVDDCYRGLRWVHENAGVLGIDPFRIGVMGTSAGGGLAAALAILCRDRGGPPVAFQVLDSPMLDDRQGTPSSRRDGLPVWSRESNEFAWRSYLGDLHGRDDVPATAAPARADDLADLPPTLLGVGAVDGLLDEGLDFARRLAAADVPVDVRVYAGACHGYQIAEASLPARRWQHDLDEWLRARIGRRPASASRGPDT